MTSAPNHTDTPAMVHLVVIREYMDEEPIAGFASESDAQEWVGEHNARVYEKDRMVRLGPSVPYVPVGGPRPELPEASDTPCGCRPGCDCL